MTASEPIRTRIVNALTIDVEDYFQVSAFAPHIPRSEWDAKPTRVEENVELILSMLAEHTIRATFFTLGWVAERRPALVRRVAAAGHEIASHGYAHHRASDLTREEFESDITRAKALLEDTTGQPVRGYRAPSFSIGAQNEWAFECIAEAGYHYSSSVYPIKHDHYGMPSAPRFPHAPHPGLLELPLTTTRMLGRNLPAGGGGYFRLLPYQVSRWFIQRVNRIDGHPAIFYFHPWEVDPDQPRVEGIGVKTRFRHYLNLEHTERRVRRLLADFRWDRVDRVFLGKEVT
jgi:polysaccharide deacetylase family protein (PEP-CTERM system associated)